MELRDDSYHVQVCIHETHVSLPNHVQSRTRVDETGFYSKHCNYEGQLGPVTAGESESV